MLEDWLHNRSVIADIEKRIKHPFDGQPFSSEKTMQTTLRKQIEQLEKGLTIADGGTEQYDVDITAYDRSGSIVIIELKVLRARPYVIRQIASYMAEASHRWTKTIRGIVVAWEFPYEVKDAARRMPNLQLVQYRDRNRLRFQRVV